MFCIKQCGPERGDCTAPCKVTLDKEYLVREFIEEVLKRKWEWGYIGVKSDKSFFGDPHCEYRYGKLLDTLPDDYMPRKVKSVTADGGWSRMDYILELED